MRNKILIIAGCIFFLGSCISKKYPTPQSTYWGIIMTCTTDSSALTNEKTVRLKMENLCKKKECATFKNQECENRPAYINAVSFWPSNINLDFKKNTYFILHSPSPVDPDIDPNSRDFAVRFRHDGGKLDYDRKTGEMILTSIFFNWSKKYKISYSAADSVLTMISQ